MESDSKLKKSKIPHKTGVLDIKKVPFYEEKVKVPKISKKLTK